MGTIGCDFVYNLPMLLADRPTLFYRYPIGEHIARKPPCITEENRLRYTRHYHPCRYPRICREGFK